MVEEKPETNAEAKVPEETKEEIIEDIEDSGVPEQVAVKEEALDEKEQAKEPKGKELEKAAEAESVEPAKEKTLEERTSDLNDKKSELDEIVNDTQKEEEVLLKNRQDYENIIEERLLTAYKKIRKNARNGLAVVTVERDACGGCFNKIPPQRQLDIRSKKKIIVCEYCGRILVDIDIPTEDEK